MDLSLYKPAGLGVHAERFWTDVTTTYGLRYDELVVLARACREIDLIEEISQAQQGRAMVTLGSMGQEVADPMIQELRQHSATLAGLLRQLKLPDDGVRKGAETRQDASEKARMAANTRWSRVRNAG